MDDMEWKKVLEESCGIKLSKQVRELFVVILTLFSTAFWPTYLAGGGIFTPLGIFDFRAQKSGFKGKAVYHPKI